MRTNYKGYVGFMGFRVWGLGFRAWGFPKIGGYRGTITRITAFWGSIFGFSLNWETIEWICGVQS